MGANRRFAGPSYIWGVVAMWWAVVLSGCGPSFETTPRAVPLPPVARDRLETGENADAWPGWRGWNASGIAPGGHPPIRFGPSAGYRWKVAVPGQGNSSPVVWGDHVLVTSAFLDSDPPQAAVLSYDRQTGRLNWQATVPLIRGRTHPKNGYASATVTTDGDRIAAFFGSSGLCCIDFEGRVLWRADLGRLDHQWGTASSPVRVGENVVQLCDCAHNSYLVAYHFASGRRVWRTPRPSHGCWTTPVVVEVRRGGSVSRELVVNGGAEDADGRRMVVAYDPATGKELWRVRGTSDLVAPTILVGEGLIYSTSGRNGPILAIRPGGRGDVTDTHVVWQYRRGGPYIPTGVVYRNRLYVVGDSGHMACYNAGDGQRLWTARLRGPFTASLIAADGRIYATNERGTVFVIAAADSFRLLATNRLDERCLATPAVAGGDLFIRTEGHLYCFPEAPTAVASGGADAEKLPGT